MSKGLKSSKQKKLKFVQLIYILIFIITLAFRVSIALKFPVTSYEAKTLLNFINRSSNTPIEGAIIETALIKLSFFIFNTNDLAARMWPILMGSLLVLLPLYLNKKMDSIVGLFLSIMIAIDPFLLVNSIQVGSNIFAIVGLVYSIGAIWKNDIKIAIPSLFITLFAGRGMIVALILLIAFYIIDNYYRWGFVRRFSDEIKKKFAERSNLPSTFLIIICIILIVINIFSLDISSIFIDFIRYYKLGVSNFKVGELPQTYLVAFVSYSPLIIFTFAYWVISNLKNKKTNIWIVVAVISTISIVILFNRHHEFIDLAWISCLLMIFCVKAFSDYVKKVKFNNSSELIRTIPFLICLITLTTTFGMFISQGIFGYSQMTSLISLVTTLLVIIMLLILFIYLYSLREAVFSFTNALFIILLVFQLSSLFRTAGLSGDRYQEIIWAGRSFDKPTVIKQIKSFNKTKDMVVSRPKIAILNTNSQEILWELRNYNVETFTGEVLALNTNYDFVISRSESFNAELPFYGQTFIEDAFPNWTTKPLRYIFDYDYWTWMFFRSSAIYKTEQFFWIQSSG